MNQDFAGQGRRHLQNESYGAAAFCFYLAIRQRPEEGSAWNGLALSLSLMRKETDTQVILARYAMQPQLPYDKQLVSIAFMMFRNHPEAMAGWVRSITNRPGVSARERQSFASMAEDIEANVRKMAEERGEEASKREGMLTLEEFAAKVIELDIIAQGGADNVFAQAEAWLNDEATALTAIRALCLLPDPRSERMLRRVCRDESIPAKMRTHALLALRWLGVRGRVRIHKLGESFAIDLDAPDPELSLSVPKAFKPALDRMMLWMAKEKGAVTPEEYAGFSATEDKELPPALAAKVGDADLPGLLQEVVHTVIRNAYDEYYPAVPSISGYRSWSNAFLLVMKEYVEASGGSWEYGSLEKDDTAEFHRRWLLSAMPDFFEQITAGRNKA